MERKLDNDCTKYLTMHFMYVTFANTTTTETSGMGTNYLVYHTGIALATVYSDYTIQYTVYSMYSFYCVAVFCVLTRKFELRRQQLL